MCVRELFGGLLKRYVKKVYGKLCAESTVLRPPLMNSGSDVVSLVGIENDEPRRWKEHGFCQETCCQNSGDSRGKEKTRDQSNACRQHRTCRQRQNAPMKPESCAHTDKLAGEKDAQKRVYGHHDDKGITNVVRRFPEPEESRRNRNREDVDGANTDVVFTDAS